jgi:hypothetical protein
VVVVATVVIEGTVVATVDAAATVGAGEAASWVSSEELHPGKQRTSRTNVKALMA